MLCPRISELPPPPPHKTGWPWTEAYPQTPKISTHGSRWPKISVVTPSFNQCIFIEETIRSVLLQGYPNLEYIIIDAGSTDGSLEIIRKYEPWLSYWTSEPDRGQSDAINKGWKKSTGEILAWINSDDLYQTNAFQKITTFFAKHKNIDMVYGDCEIIDEKGQFKDNCPVTDFNLKSLVCNKWFVAQPATFIQRTVFESVGGLKEDLHLVMDWEFWLRIALNGFGICYIPEPLAKYRQWANAKTSSQAVKSGEEKVQVLNHFFHNPLFYSNIIRYRNQAYSYVHRWAGNANYIGENFRTAAAHFSKALRYRPSLVGNRKFLKVAILALKRSVLP